MSAGCPYFEPSPVTELLGQCEFDALLKCAGARHLNAQEALAAGIASQHLGRWSDAKRFAKKWALTNPHVETGPLVSIIVPTHNRPAMLERALHSVANQLYRPVEAVVVNDAGDSIETAINAVRDQIPVIERRNEENLYLAASRNVGSHAASGTYIGFLDDDDQLYPHHVGHLMAIRTGVQRGAVGGSLLHRVQTRPEGGTAREQLAEFLSGSFAIGDLLRRNAVPVQALLVERTWLARVDGFDVNLRAQEDWDCWIKLAAGGAFAQSYVPTATVDQRAEGSRMSDRRAAFYTSYGHLRRRHRRLSQEIGGDALLAYQRKQHHILWAEAAKQALSRRVAVLIYGEGRQVARQRLQHLCRPYGQSDLLRECGSQTREDVLTAALDLASCVQAEYVAVVAAQCVPYLRPNFLIGLVLQLDSDDRTAATCPLDPHHAKPDVLSDILHRMSSGSVVDVARDLEGARSGHSDLRQTLSSPCLLLRSHALRDTIAQDASVAMPHRLQGSDLGREVSAQLVQHGWRLRVAYDTCLVMSS